MRSSYITCSKYLFIILKIGKPDDGLKYSKTNSHIIFNLCTMISSQIQPFPDLRNGCVPRNFMQAESYVSQNFS